jgi:hypothetical protein
MDKEMWFIFTHRKESWGNLRVATFVKSNTGRMDVVFIHNEPPERTGPRVWDDIVEREGWFKVRQIEVPTAEEVARVCDEGLRQIATEIREEFFR